MTPATAQRCRNQSMWHWDSAAVSSSSGFHRPGSPRNEGSELAAMAAGPSARTSWSRSYARYPLVPVPRFPVQVTETSYECMRVIADIISLAALTHPHRPSRSLLSSAAGRTACLTGCCRWPWRRLLRMGPLLLRGERRGGGALDRCPAGVFVVLGPLGLAAAAQPEQPLGDQQVGHDGQVDDQGDDLQRRDALGQLVDLIRDEDDGGDEGQVFGPPAAQPQPDRLRALQDRISGDGSPSHVQVGNADREQIVQVVNDAVIAVDRAAQ